jgi:hypothetical protein
MKIFKKDSEIVANKNIVEIVPLFCNRHFEKLCWMCDSSDFLNCIERLQHPTQIKFLKSKMSCKIHKHVCFVIRPWKEKIINETNDHSWIVTTSISSSSLHKRIMDRGSSQSSVLSSTKRWYHLYIVDKQNIPLSCTDVSSAWIAARLKHLRVRKRTIGHCYIV